MKSIVLSNNIIHDAEKIELINELEINKRKFEKTQLRVSLVNHSQFTNFDHKFLESGHSSLPNDRDLSSIETAKLRQSRFLVYSGLILNGSDYNRRSHFTIKFRYNLNDMEGWKTLDFTSTRS